MALASTLMVWAPDPEVPRMRSSMLFFRNLYTLKRRSRKFLVRQDPGLHSNKLTAPQPLGPMAQDHLVTLGTRDADLMIPQTLMIGAVLLRFPCEQHHKGVTKWINNLCEESNMPADNRPVTIHCKAGSMSVKLVFETRAKCQDFVPRYKDDGIPCEIDSPFCGVKTTITVRQSRSIEDRVIGKQFAP